MIERVSLSTTGTHHHLATRNKLAHFCSRDIFHDHFTSPSFFPSHHTSLHRCIPLTQDGNVVLISSRSGSWILPKGGWEKDETAREAAARETYEESGVRGFVGLEPLAEISYRSKRGEACQLLLFVMEVTEILTEWPESLVRQRKLFSLSEAINVCGKEEHRGALRELKLRGLHTLPHYQLHGAGSHLVDDFGATMSADAAMPTMATCARSSSSNSSSRRCGTTREGRWRGSGTTGTTGGAGEEGTWRRPTERSRRSNHGSLPSRRTAGEAAVGRSLRWRTTTWTRTFHSEGSKRRERKRGGARGSSNIACFCT